MKTHTITSREFNHNSTEAKRAALEGPVLITNRGEPEFVLMSIMEYQRLRKRFTSLYKAMTLAADDSDDDFDPPKLNIELKSADL